MSWSAPPTYTVGEVLTAALMNNVSGNLLFLYDIPSSQVVWGGSTQTITTGTNPTIQLVTATYDPLSMWSGGVCTIPQNGKYDLTFNVGLNAVATGMTELQILLNGSEVHGALFYVPTTGTNVSAPTLVIGGQGLTLGDEVKLNFYNTTGADLTIAAGYTNAAIKQVSSV